MPPSDDEHDQFIPRPPLVKTTADFIVIVFVMVIAAILTAFAFTVVIGGIFTNNDMSSYVTLLTDIMSAILGALIGFIAGKGTAEATKPE